MEIPSNLEATFDPSFSAMGPMKMRLPDYVVDYLNDVCDGLSVESGDPNYSDFLAGKLLRGEEIGIPLDKLHQNFLEFVLTVSKQYIWTVSRKRESVFKEFRVEVGKVWCNKQLAKDFNPVHSHTGLLAGIIYLKVPEQINIETMEGCLDFVYGRNKFGSLDFDGNRRILPVVGDMYVFPAWMLHVVYPFYGEGERRSVAFNVYNKNTS